MTTTPISFKRKTWLLPPDAPAPDAIANLANALHLPPLIASLLLRRNLLDAPTATAFLEPQFKTLHDPALLPNISRAVQRLTQALAEKQKIVLFGDYDVDGVTGTAILWHTLKAAGAIPGQTLCTYIPHRVEEGYGLSVPAIEQLIQDGAKVMITIDCGISGHAPIAKAQEAGLDVIVTDHHDLPRQLPPAHTIVHPRLAGSQYPNGNLCGAGVAYKLAWALAAHLCGGGKVNGVYKSLLIEFAALVALATIADVVPLLGENRTLVKYGLAQIPRSSLPGIQALLAAAGYGSGTGACKIDGTAVGFSLAPRLNAAGRMDHADLACELLTSAAPDRAREIAEYLETQNKDRQATEKQMTAAAIAQIDASLAGGAPLPSIIVVDSPHHHAGVVGIVASRLVDTYRRPAFVLSSDDTECHGSARSIPAFDLHAAIEHTRHLLLSGGGHAMAGGVKLLKTNLLAFRAALNAYAATVLTPAHFIPTLHIDAPLTLAEATVPFVTCLQQFGPFGQGNPHPHFLLQRVRLTAPPRRVGATGAHLQLSFSQDRHFVRGIAFKAGELANTLYVGIELDLVVEPRLDHFTGSPKVDLLIVDLARADGQPFDLAASSL